ncbi:MAG: thioredoxin family protein [Bacteroidetes bacterium]|nr:thioredoxin family protein [Fibrella sp.]
MTAAPAITPALLASAMPYAAFVVLSKTLLAERRTTSDDPLYNTDQIIQLTDLNLHRISRLERTTTLNPALVEAAQAVPEPWTWLVLVESWCGDVAQCLPVIKQVADQNPLIDLKLLLRDKNPALMDAYRTNGGRSIPKLICLTTGALVELGTWGPRPATLQTLMDGWKAEQISFDDLLERVHGWYAKDRTQTVQAELLTLIQTWSEGSGKE